MGDDLGVRHLRFERRGAVAWCTIDRPEARNALTRSMYRGIGKALHLAAADPEIGALVLTGTGDVFVPGGDIGPAGEDEDASAPVSSLLPFRSLRTTPVAVVAAVNGICYASGMLFAMLADVAVASERATFRAPELVRGFPDMWSAAVFPQHLGMGRARDLLFTARRIDAAEALSMGVVTRVVEHDRLSEAAEDVAYEILETAPEARMHWKRAANALYGVVDEATLDAAPGSAEVQEGFEAFFAKRPPAWSRQADRPPR